MNKKILHFRYIERRMEYIGVINRSDIARLFNVSLTTATRSISSYRKKCPGNIVLSGRNGYVKNDGYTPRYL